jgi:FkbM family methyltransferase
MLIEKLKDGVKAVPPLYHGCRPLWRYLKQARLAAREKARDRAINRFRKYCLNLSKRVAKPVFVKVGANDGIGDDPCSDIFLADPAWSGVLIEPVPYCFERLKKNFPDTGRFAFEQIAVGSPAGEAPFYFVDPKARDTMPNWEDWFDKLGSFDRNHILKHANGVLEPYIVAGRVPVLPLTEVLVRHGLKHVHLLHIDAEGYDYEVLKTLDFSRFAPLTIFIEHFHLSAEQKREMLQFLARHGYAVHDCISDYFAVHREADQRLRRNPERQT